VQSSGLAVQEDSMGPKMRRTLRALLVAALALGVGSAIAPTANAQVAGFSVTPASLYFGDIGLDQPSSALSVEVAYPKGWALDGTITIAGADPADFTYDADNFGRCSTFPGPNDCPAAFTFTPHVFGNRSANATFRIVQVAAPHAAETVTIVLAGVGSTNLGSPDPTTPDAPDAVPADAVVAAPRFTG
jgi:hypothetical protein